MDCIRGFIAPGGDYFQEDLILWSNNCKTTPKRGVEAILKEGWVGRKSTVAYVDNVAEMRFKLT